MTLTDIINDWLVEKKLDNIYVIRKTGTFPDPILMFRSDIVAFQHVQQCFIAFVRDDSLMWWNNLPSPYNWPPNWGPIIMPLRASSLNFFDELEDVLTRIYRKYFPDDTCKHHS